MALFSFNEKRIDAAANADFTNSAHIRLRDKQIKASESSPELFQMDSNTFPGRLKLSSCEVRKDQIYPKRYFLPKIVENIELSSIAEVRLK